MAFGAGLAGLVALSLTPRPPQVLVDNFGDLVLHFSAYCLLAIAAMFGWPGRIVLAIVFLPVLGFALELGQISVPGRGFEWADALANTFGAAIGVLVGWRSQRLYV